MSSLIGILCLLSALAATGYALSCTQCFSSELTCSGHSMTCLSGHQCGSSYTEFFIAGTKSVSFVRSCVPSSQCGLTGSVGLQQGYVRMDTSCCNTNKCTPDPPMFPSISSNPNGLVCRSCMSADSTWCYTDDTMQCTGEENRCLLMTTRLSGSVSASTAIRGCASKPVCDMGSKSAKVGVITSEVNFICTNSGLSVHNIILTPAIVCLLLLKLFF